MGDNPESVRSGSFNLVGKIQNLNEERVFDVLSQDADNEYAAIDATIVPAHQDSAGAKKKSR